jgi:putative pyruvate formate lyase activating enzyme
MVAAGAPALEVMQVPRRKGSALDSHDRQCYAEGMEGFRPAYLKLLEEGELQPRAKLARELQHACVLCARQCRIDRRAQVGACHTRTLARVASYGAHHGEENPLRGWRGSGTLFFAGCNLRCVYCQNAEISQTEAGRENSSLELAEIMLALQRAGCHNLNLVSPSHVVAEFLEALAIAAASGLRLPVVYNTGGYDSPQALDLLDGIVDIYMPDMKYASNKLGRTYSGVSDYATANRRAVRIMHRQVGDLIIGEDGLARRGLLVRHLILPGNQAGTASIVRFLAREISPHTYLNLMTQYRPSHLAWRFPALDHLPAASDFQRAAHLALGAGLHRLDHRAAR